MQKTSIAYDFPVHPKVIFDKTPNYVSDETRHLRATFIFEIIADKFKVRKGGNPNSPYFRNLQKHFDAKTKVHYSKLNGNIIGFVLHEMMYDIKNDHEGLIELGLMDEKAWTNMNVQHLLD